MRINYNEIVENLNEYKTIYVVEDAPKYELNISGDVFEEYYTTKEEAINVANSNWGYLTKSEKAKRRISAYVLDTSNYDECFGFSGYGETIACFE